MSQLISVTVTNRGKNPNPDSLKTPTLYGFDVEDIVSPIRRNGNLGRSYFTARTNKDGANNNLNGSKIDYMVSDTLASIVAQSPRLLLLNVVSRRGVNGNSEQYIFVSSKITEDITPLNGGAKFYYIEDGDPLPVEYIVSQSVAAIVAASIQPSNFRIQKNGVNMPIEPKLNFIEFLVEDNPGNQSTDITAVKSITYAALNALVAVGNLPLGAKYLITDRADAGIIVEVSAPNKISLRAKGLFLVPDFQDVGTYTTTPSPKGTNQKVWSLSEQSGAPYADSDIVFWDGIMYQVIDDTLFDTNSPDLNASAYAPLTKNVNNGYILEADDILYDFVNNSIIKREDKRGNSIYSVNDFQWGNDTCYKNTTIGQSGIIFNINQKGVYTSNIINNGDVTTTNAHLGELSGNIFDNCSAGLTISLNLNVSVINCKLTSISGVFDPSVSYTSCYANHGYSDFVAELDMSDVAVFSAGTLTLPSLLNHIGTYLLNNNSGQTITKIIGILEPQMGSGASNYAVIKKRFKVQSGNTQSFQNVAVAGAVANTLNADVVATNAIIGRTNSSDFIEYERRGNKNIRTNIVKLA